MIFQMRNALICPKQINTFVFVRIFSPVKKRFGTVAVKVHGVGIFRDAEPSKVGVLFGRIESDALRQIADGIAERFIEEGFAYLILLIHFMLGFNWVFFFICRSVET